MSTHTKICKLVPSSSSIVILTSLTWHYKTLINILYHISGFFFDASMLWEIYSRKTNQQKYSRTCAIGHLNFFDIPWHPTKMYGPKVFLLIKIRPEYSDILYNQTHFPGLLVCQIRQVLTSCTIRHISLVPWCVRLDRFWHPVQSDTFPWSLGVSD